MSSIGEDLNSQGNVEDEFEIPENAPLESAPLSPTSSPGINFDFISKLMELLGKPTGEGSIEEYIEHPLNFGKSKGMAQIIRGFTGLFGDLKKAVIDIAIGYFNLSKEKKGAANDN